MTPTNHDETEGEARRRVLWEMPPEELRSVRCRVTSGPRVAAGDIRRLQFDLAVARNAIEYLSDAATALCNQRDRAERLLLVETGRSARLNRVVGELRAEIETLKG